MASLTISLNDEELRYPEQTAQKFGIRVEELVRLGVDEYVARHRRFEQAGRYVLQKNAELYRRLAGSPLTE